MPLSTQLTSIPSMVSTRLPVGSSAPVVEPAVSANRSRIGAAVPGTPSIAVLPAYSGLPPGVANVAVTTLPVFIIAMRVVVVSVVAPRRRHDRDLRRERVAAANAVDLQRMAAAHNRDQQPVAFIGVGWQVPGHEVEAARRAATHLHAPDAAAVSGGAGGHHSAIVLR